MSVPSVVLLFAGQGSQTVGMGASLAAGCAPARELLARAESILGYSLGTIMREGPEDELTRTSICQPALFTHGMMCLAALRERLPNINVTGAAGLSLGEFTAHAAAETFSFEAGLRLVAKRGAFMEDACSEADGGMAAVIGGTVEQVRSLADMVGAEVANYNAPGQTVISGSSASIEQAVAKAKEAGCRMAKPLKVAGAYHSRFMKSAQERLAKELADVSLAAPKFPVVSNFTAQPAVGKDAIRDTLVRQVTGSVRWVESMEFLLGRGESVFLELGPGKALTGMMNRIRPEARCLPAGELADLDAAVAALKQ